MAWTSARTWTAGEIITASIMNTHVRDNLRYLHGDDGVPTILSGLAIDNTDGDEYLKLPSLTTTQRDALTPANGMVIYNSTTNEFNKYENGGWADLADATDHGGLDGLGDDDHTQYQLKSLLTTAGDIIYATGASTWARLGAGTVGHILSVASGGNAPEWRAETARTNKLKTESRLAATASGDVAYTGYGFQPTSLIVIAGGSNKTKSTGLADVNLAEVAVYQIGAQDHLALASQLIHMEFSAGNGQTAVLKTLDADGFTLTWTKSGTGGGDFDFGVLALR